MAACLASQIPWPFGLLAAPAVQLGVAGPDNVYPGILGEILAGIVARDTWISVIRKNTDPDSSMTFPPSGR